MMYDGAEGVPTGIALPLSSEVAFNVLALGLRRGEWMYDTLVFWNHGTYIEWRRRLVPAITPN